MANELVINTTSHETRIALIENGTIAELYIERSRVKGIVGNIYMGRVIRVLPGMQAAFVDIGLEKAAFLYVADVFESSSPRAIAVSGVLVVKVWQQVLTSVLFDVIDDVFCDGVASHVACHQRLVENVALRNWHDLSDVRTTLKHQTSRSATSEETQD